jgi:hypothetical protein
MAGADMPGLASFAVILSAAKDLTGRSDTGRAAGVGPSLRSKSVIF